jgi:hypothetical protein
MWLPEYGRWVRVQRNEVHVDASGYAVGPRNVIVMEVDYGTSAADRRSPEADTVGSGPASIFTDGKLLEGRWERVDEDARFSFLDRAGRPVALTPGRTWIELVRSGTTTVLR